MKTLLLCALMVLPSLLFAQDYDNRLLDSYSQETLDAIAQDDPAKIQVLNYALDNAMYFADGGNTKGTELMEITVPEGATSFVDLKLQITDQNQYFKVSGEDKLLVVKSFWVLSNELETARP